MSDIRTILGPFTDQADRMILDEKVMIPLMGAFLGVAVLGYIACHFIPKKRGRTRH